MVSVVVLGLALVGSLTNLEMLEDVVADAIEPIAQQVSEQGIETVTLEITGEHDGGWLIEQTATSVLDQTGVTVSTSRDASGWILRLRPMEFGVTYAHTKRNWILGRKQIPRVASCQIAATLVDSEGNVVFTEREGAVLNSMVPMSEIVLMESSTEKWVNGEITEDEGGNILEPLVVTGVVTALVYLFYSSRN